PDLGAETVAGQLGSLTDQLRRFQTVSQAAAEAAVENTRASRANTIAQANTGGSTAETIGQTLQSVFGLGLGISPLITGLLGLFGGGGSNTAPPPLVKFALPPAVNVNAGISEAARGEAFA